MESRRARTSQAPRRGGGDEDLRNDYDDLQREYEQLQNRHRDIKDSLQAELVTAKTAFAERYNQLERAHSQDLSVVTTRLQEIMNFCLTKGTEKKLLEENNNSSQGTTERAIYGTLPDNVKILVDDYVDDRLKQAGLLTQDALRNTLTQFKQDIVFDIRQLLLQRDTVLPLASSPSSNDGGDDSNGRPSPSHQQTNDNNNNNNNLNPYNQPFQLPFMSGDNKPSDHLSLVPDPQGLVNGSVVRPLSGSDVAALVQNDYLYDQLGGDVGTNHDNDGAAESSMNIVSPPPIKLSKTLTSATTVSAISTIGSPRIPAGTGGIAAERDERDHDELSLDEEDEDVEMEHSDPENDSDNDSISHEQPHHHSHHHGRGGRSGGGRGRHHHHHHHTVGDVRDPVQPIQPPTILTRTPSDRVNNGVIDISGLSSPQGSSSSCFSLGTATPVSIVISPAATPDALASSSSASSTSSSSTVLPLDVWSPPTNNNNDERQLSQNAETCVFQLAPPNSCSASSSGSSDHVIETKFQTSPPPRVPRLLSSSHRYHSNAVTSHHHQNQIMAHASSSNDPLNRPFKRTSSSSSRVLPIIKEKPHQEIIDEWEVSHPEEDECIENNGSSGSTSTADNVHIAVLQLSPLSQPQLNLALEKERIIRSIKETNRKVRVQFGIGSMNNFSKILTKGVRVFHFSGHGHGQNLVLEDDMAELQLLNSKLLRSMLESSGRAHDIKLVFISACFSSHAALAFVEAGVSHVVAVQENTRVTDHAARIFAEHFYLALCSGQTVQTSFQAGCSAVMGSQSRTTACCCAHLHTTDGCSTCKQCGFPACCKVHAAPCHEYRSCCQPQTPHDESLKFLLLPANQNHDVKLFDDLERGHWQDVMPEPEHNLPSIPEQFKARVTDTMGVFRFVMRSRLTTIVGMEGVGKTALARAVAYQFHDRRHFENGVFWVKLGDCTQIEQLPTRIAHALRLHVGRNTSMNELTMLINSHLRGKHTLLVWDNCDALMQKDIKNFRDCLQTIMDSERRCTVLITARQSIDGLDGVSHRVWPLSGLNLQDSVMLFADRLPNTKMKPDLTHPLIAKSFGNPRLIEWFAQLLQHDVTMDEVDNALDVPYFESRWPLALKGSALFVRVRDLFTQLLNEHNPIRVSPTSTAPISFSFPTASISTTSTPFASDSLFGSAQNASSASSVSLVSTSL